MPIHFPQCQIIDNILVERSISGRKKKLCGNVSTNESRKKIAGGKYPRMIS
jgi:hypothetical protein